jgi:hypothetical protein
MRLSPILLSTAFVWGTAVYLLADGPVIQTTTIPVYVTPYYNSKGIKIDVGSFSKPLASATKKSILTVAADMKREWETLPVEAMYVLAIRLYDFGHKDDAVYWYYAAQWRGRLFGLVVPPDFSVKFGNNGFERAHAYSAFQELAGHYINGYAFGDLPKLQEKLTQVKADCEKVPALTKIYPDATFIVPELWTAKNKEVATGFEKLQKTIIDSADEIKATRAKNGMDGKF